MNALVNAAIAALVKTAVDALRAYLASPDGRAAVAEVRDALVAAALAPTAPPYRPDGTPDLGPEPPLADAVDGGVLQGPPPDEPPLP